MPCNENCNGTINGIYCIASNCVHHTKDDRCTAEQIKVDNSTATQAKETCCSTFRLKD